MPDNAIRLLVTAEGAGIEATELFSDTDIRRLYFWLYDSLRRENCIPGHRLLLVASKAVYEQGYSQGWADADEGKDLLVSKHSAGPFKDGYEQGFVERKSKEEG